MRVTTTRVLALLMLALLGVALLGGCGGGDDAAEGAGDDTPEVTGGEGAVVVIPAAAQDLAYQVEMTRAPAGAVTLRMPNPSTISHNIAVEEPEVAVGEIVGEGGVSEITVSFPPGEYLYFCTVPSHRELGMEGTLVITG